MAKYLGRMLCGEFVMNKKYLLKEELAQERETAAKRDPKPIVESRRVFAGATYLFDRIRVEIGVAEDIKSCFQSIHKDMLSSGIDYFDLKC